MKIVIPTNDKRGLKGIVADHFGRCQTYTFLDTEGGFLEVIENTSEHMGGVGLPPELMKKNGADILLCKGLGLRALELCQQLGIDVYVSDKESVEDVFNEWKNNNAKKAGMEDACDHH
jgi:predicted Fe-Mo cluster-binding NifX family protein